MSAHSFFAPSKAAMWMVCPGSMAMPENQSQENTPSKFADDGTASHYWSSEALQQKLDANAFLGRTLRLNGSVFLMNEERADFCQVYIDDVRRRAISGLLFVEYRVNLFAYLGEGQGGTADALIYLPLTQHLICEDLKYGTGEKVYAQTNGEINPQLGLYLLGTLDDMELLGYEVKTATGVICQPRLGHIDEYTISIHELREFGRKAALAVKQAHCAMVQAPGSEGLAVYFNPGEKQCRWCRGDVNCPALAKKVADEVRLDFETIQSDPPPVPPIDTKSLAKAYLAVPLIENWCRAVKAEVTNLVAGGLDVIGPDGKPYKFVEGKQGARSWSDPKAAETALVGQLGPKAYTEPKVITAPVASKLLDKKATKQIWKDLFEPLIKRITGQPVLALGSDPRPTFVGAAGSDEFEDINE